MRLPGVLVSVLVRQSIQNDVDHAKQKRIRDRSVALNVEREHPFADLQLRCKRINPPESDGGSRQKMTSSLCGFQGSSGQPIVRPSVAGLSSVAYRWGRKGDPCRFGHGVNARCQCSASDTTIVGQW